MSPSTPVLNSSGLKRGQPGNVSCESSRTRPAANPYLYLDNRPKSAEKTVTLDKQTGEYSVTTWTGEINENHEGHDLICCVTHVTIPIATPLCTASQKIKFKCKYNLICYVTHITPYCTQTQNAVSENNI